MMRGLDWDDQHFDVHRWYDGLIYGRRGDARNGEGIAFCRSKPNSSDTSYVYALITYAFPVVSARAVSLLQSFRKEHCK